MTQLAQAFPWLISLALLGLCGFAARLGTKRSQGAAGAGPAVRPEASIPGLNAAAWDLKSIEQTLSDAPAETLRGLREIAHANGVNLPPVSSHLPTDIERALTTLEQELGIR